jgi:hypothetical protein
MTPQLIFQQGLAGRQQCQPEALSLKSIVEHEKTPLSAFQLCRRRYRRFDRLWRWRGWQWCPRPRLRLPAQLRSPARLPTGSCNHVGCPSPAVAAATAVRVNGVAYPFGARLDAYVAGTLPSQTKPAMDALLTKQYDAWKAANVVSADSIVAGGLAVKFSGAGFLAVSEGMGYGMLLAVLFAGHDPQARTVFDGLLSVVRARPAYGTGKAALMEWKLYANGTSAGEGWNAMDGDEDIAMAPADGGPPVGFRGEVELQGRSHRHHQRHEGAEHEGRRHDQGSGEREQQPDFRLHDRPLPRVQESNGRCPLGSGRGSRL